MTSYIQVQKICQYCNAEFTAKTTVTKYCSATCSKRAYKARKRGEMVQEAKAETLKLKNGYLNEVQAREFLSVREVAILLGCSLRSVYRLISNGTLKAVNLSERITRVKRSDIDKLLK
jgi:excisionase family DNA binding protein